MTDRSRTSVFRFAFCIACFSFFISSPAFSQDWTLSTADFRTEQVALHSIDEKGVHVIAAGQTKPHLVPAESFLQIDRSLASVDRPAKFMLHLLSGDRIGGEPVKVENDRLTWRSAAVGELTIPLTQVASLTKPGQPPADLAARRSEDVVQLANGDTVRGIVTSLTGETVQVKAGGADEPTGVPLNSVVAVHFASSGAAPVTGPAAKDVRTYRVRLDDGSSIVATALELAGDKLNITIKDGGDPRPIPIANVAGIEQVNGPVSWLTSRQPSQDVQVPFIGSANEAGLWKTRIDTDVSGQPLVVVGRTFKRGIGVHAYSRLAYPLDGTHKAFRTRYGINDSLFRADVTVRIKVGDKTVHEAKNVRAGALSPVVVVDLPADARELVLEVDYGEGIDVEDRLNWLEPALLRDKPKAPQTQPAAAQ